ncbi:MAG: hypothetical protein HC945_00885 [Nitrosarchaeum sp.]|nr:hypothetical protein [Nitrosarchaeum sp.]
MILWTCGGDACCWGVMVDPEDGGGGAGKEGRVNDGDVQDDDEVGGVLLDLAQVLLGQGVSGGSRFSLALVLAQEEVGAGSVAIIVEEEEGSRCVIDQCSCFSVCGHGEV